MSLAKTKKKKRRAFLKENRRKHGSKINFEYLSNEEINNFKSLLKHDERVFNEFTLAHENTLLIGFDEVGRGCVAGPVCTGAYSCSSFYENPDILIAEVEESYQELNDLSNLLLLEDSKKVPHNKREKLCKALLDVPNSSDNFHIFYSTNFQDAKKIDKEGIVHCIWLSMAENLLSIVLAYINIKNKYPNEVIMMVDGPRGIPELRQMLENLIKKKKIKDLNFCEEDINPHQQNLKLKSNFITIKQLKIIKGDDKSSLIAAASNIAKLTRDEYMQGLDDKHGYGWHKNVGYGTKKHFGAIQEFGISEYHRKSFLGNLLLRN